MHYKKLSTYNYWYDIRNYWQTIVNNSYTTNNYYTTIHALHKTTSTPKLYTTRNQRSIPYIQHFPTRQHLPTLAHSFLAQGGGGQGRGIEISPIGKTKPARDVNAREEYTGDPGEGEFSAQPAKAISRATSGFVISFSVGTLFRAIDQPMRSLPCKHTAHTRHGETARPRYLRSLQPVTTAVNVRGLVPGNEQIQSQHRLTAI